MFEVTTRWGDETIEIRHVGDATGIVTGRIGLVDVTVERVSLPPRSLPYTRGDDHRVAPYLGLALLAHLALWGVATTKHPVVDEPVPVKPRPYHRARIVDTSYS